ncbi:salicylate carboxymethyltransferase isoform X2 [Zea mays]|uniref:salicylate carboxymethyltransferase isoform X2 n=1 Tax=Zea mays TaxID=4577 RepID=UPI0009A9B1C6|nr:salicylate carboxymethyltransferase isoform X2 [Zea mays]|eukprot:XP_020405688.1 salicylate carboxymethyltransferase isoform X2 [Zea mays]
MASGLQCPDKHTSMNVEAVLHMKSGLGESSYAQNSSHQKKSTETLRSLVMDSATLVYEALRPESFTVADLGCASGTNALGVVEAIVRGVGEACRGRGPSSSSPPPEFSVLLNDLASNDFNTVFARAPEVAGRLKADAGAVVFLSGVPGSFYGRLFLCRSVHLVCSFNSLHWLSQVPAGLRDETNKPLNKGKMFISSTSSPAVPAAYLRQFQKDFNLFLRSRGAEVVSGGRMVLSMLCRETEDYTDVKMTLLWDLLSESLAALVSQVSCMMPFRLLSVVSSCRLLVATDRSDPCVRKQNGSLGQEVRWCGGAGTARAGCGGRLRRPVLRAERTGDRGGGEQGRLLQPGLRADVRRQPEQRRRR